MQVQLRRREQGRVVWERGHVGLIVDTLSLSAACIAPPRFRLTSIDDLARAVIAYFLRIDTIRDLDQCHSEWFPFCREQSLDR